MRVRSILHRHEAVANRDRKFGADGLYYPCRVVGPDGEVMALFTQAQLEAAIQRAADNPEDLA